MLKVTQLSGFSSGQVSRQILAPALTTNNNTIYDPTIAGDSWLTAFIQTLNSTDPGWGTNTLRIVIPSSLLSESGTQVRITLQSGGGGCVINESWIGEQATSGDAWDMKASTPSPTQFLFIGDPDVTIPPSTQIKSDALTFTFDETKNYVFGFEISGGDIRIRNSVTGAVSKYGSAGEASTPDVTGYSNIGAGTGVVALVARIEVLP